MTRDAISYIEMQGSRKPAELVVVDMPFRFPRRDSKQISGFTSGLQRDLDWRYKFGSHQHIDGASNYETR